MYIGMSVCLNTFGDDSAIKSHWDDPTEDKLGVYPAGTACVLLPIYLQCTYYGTV